MCFIGGEDVKVDFYSEVDPWCMCVCAERDRQIAARARVCVFICAFFMSPV